MHHTLLFVWRQLGQVASGNQLRQMGESMSNYVLATTTESDQRGPKKPGASNGGFFEKTDDKPDQYPSVVITVDDVTANVL